MIPLVKTWKVNFHDGKSVIHSLTVHAPTKFLAKLALRDARVPYVVYRRASKVTLTPIRKGA